MSKMWVTRLSVAVCVAGALAGCGGETYESRWAAAPIKVDGDLAEWQGAMTAVDEGDVTVGFQNDGANLYLAIASKDRRLGMRALRNGLIVWLDPAGGKGRTFGVKYPVGAAPVAESDRGEAGRGERRGPPDDEQIAAMVDRASYEPQLIEDGETRLLGVGDAASRYGIDAALRMEGGTFQAEMKIPLERGEGMESGLGVAAGAALGISLDSPAMGSRTHAGGGRRGGGMGPPGGGMGAGGWGRGGAGGGTGGGPPGGGRAAMAKPIDVWVRVQTAAEG